MWADQKNATPKSMLSQFFMGTGKSQKGTAKVRKYCQKMPNCQTQISATKHLSKMPDFTYLAFSNASWQLIFLYPLGN